MTAPAAVSQQQPAGVPPFKLMAQITAYRTSQCIRVLVELGIPALLEDGPRSASELAAATGTQPELLDRLLGHLVNEEIIGRDGAGSYVALPVTGYLLPGHPQSLRNWVACELDPLLWRSWEHLADQLRSGKTAFDLAHGAAFFDFHARDSAAQKRFDDQMGGAARGIGAVVVQSLKVEPGRKVMDVGGGNGLLLAQILEHNPGTEGILFELPRTDEAFDPSYEEMQRQGRARAERGSFFEWIPGGADLYLFSRVFHDFNDEAVSAILHNTKQALAGPERLILVDIMASEAQAGARGSSQDMFMLTQLGGRERTAEDFSRLLTEAGFETVSVTPTASPVSLLEFRLAG